MRTLFVILVTAIGLAATVFSDAFYGVLLYTFYCFASPLELLWGALEGSRLSFIVAGTAIICAFIQGKKLFIKHRLVFLLALFLFISYSSLAVRHDASSADWDKLELLSRIIIVSIFTAALIDTAEKLRVYILAVAAFTGILGAYYGIWGLFAGSQQIAGPGRVGDNNGYAVWLNMSIPFIYYAGLQLKDKSWRILAKIVLLGNMIAVMLTFSRGGFIALLVASVMMFVSVKKKVILFAGIIFVAFIAMFLTLSGQPVDHNEPTLSKEEINEMQTVDKTVYQYKQRINTLFLPKEEVESAVSRAYFWGIAVKMAKDNPLLGVGLNRYPATYDLYDTTGGEFGNGRHVHSVPFLVLSETGYLGFATFIILIVSYLTATGRAKKISGGFSDTILKKEIYDYVVMLRISTVAFLVGGLFVNAPLYQEMFWAIIIVALALDRVTQRINAGEAVEENPFIKNLSERIFGR